MTRLFSARLAYLLLLCAALAPLAAAQDAASEAQLRQRVAERYPAASVRSVDIAGIDTRPFGPDDASGITIWNRVHYDLAGGRFASEQRHLWPDAPSPFFEATRYAYDGEVVRFASGDWTEVYDASEDLAAAETQLEIYGEIFRLGASIADADYLGERSYGDAASGYAFGFADGALTLLFGADGRWLASLFQSYDADLGEVPLLSVHDAVETVAGVPLPTTSRYYLVAPDGLEPSGGYRRIAVRVDAPAPELFRLPPALRDAP